MASAVLNKTTKSSQRKACDFIQLPLAAFHMGAVDDVDLYCLPQDQSIPVLYCSSDFTDKDVHIEGLVKNGYDSLYVTSSDFAQIENGLFDSLDEVVADESVAPENRFQLLQAAVSIKVDLAFRLINPKRFVTLSKQMTNHISTLFEGNDILPRGLFDVVQHDFYTFTHVTNVAGYAALLSERLGINDAESKAGIIEGALLHDIGKRFIPTKVLCKNGKLNEKERDLIETHPKRGFVELRAGGEVNYDQLLMVYQHHEKIDGTGYPVQIVGDEIHPWAKLLAIVDVFDAITSKRPYRDPMKLVDALEVLERGAGSHFDKEMVRCWTSAIREK